MGSCFTFMPEAMDQTSIFGTSRPMPVWLQFVPGTVSSVNSSQASSFIKELFPDTVEVEVLNTSDGALPNKSDEKVSEFIKTKHWKFDWKWISISDILLIREMAAVGWHGQNMNGIDMGRYLATIVPLKKGKVENKSFIRHLPDNYANAPRGLFGTFKMNDIVKKDLKKFTPISFLGRLFKRLKYMAYHLLRINIKRYFRTNKLHDDLRSGLIFK